MNKDRTIIIDTLKFLPERRQSNFIYSEPIRQNRFLVEFPYVFNIPSFTIQKITRPSLTFLNNEYNWKNIEIELLDIIGPSTSKGLMNMIEYCKNFDIRRVDNLPLFSFLLSDLDPTGTNVTTWVIDVKELVSVKFGISDYGLDEVQKCKVILKPQNCRMQL